MMLISCGFKSLLKDLKNLIQTLAQKTVLIEDSEVINLKINTKMPVEDRMFLAYKSNLKNYSDFLLLLVVLQVEEKRTKRGLTGVIQTKLYQQLQCC